MTGIDPKHFHKDEGKLESQVKKHGVRKMLPPPPIGSQNKKVSQIVPKKLTTLLPHLDQNPLFTEAPH